MGYQVVEKPNSFCKDDCKFMELNATVSKYANYAGCGEGISYSARVDVSCKNENICQMWNDETDNKFEKISELFSRTDRKRYIDNLQSEYTALCRVYDLKTSLIKLCQKHDICFVISLFETTSNNTNVEPTNLVRYYMKNLNLVQFKDKQKFCDSKF